MPRTSLALVPAALLVAVACGPRSESHAADAGAPVPIASGPTYRQDLAPIIHEKCTACHVAGGIAPFALTTYERARETAGLLAKATSSGLMPPWPPGPESAPMKHARVLSDAEKKLFVDWAAAGAPEGDPERAAPLRPPSVIDIGPTEIEKDIGVDYVPDRNLDDDYRCFMVDLATTEPRVATGYRITPGNGKVVHHVTTALFTKESRAAIEALDQQTPDKPGWSCFGGVTNVPGAEVKGSLGAWVPGVSAVAYPQGTGNPIPAGALLVMQVHYNLRGGNDPDRTRVAVAFADKDKAAALQTLVPLRVAKLDLRIPAGQSDVVMEQKLTARQWLGGRFFPDGTGYILAAQAHMHLLGRAFAITVTRAHAPGASRKILDIPSWSFHWQGSYELAEPIALAPDDEVTVRCVYDNSQVHRLEAGMGAPVDVRWGEGTEDEMCLGGLQIVDEVRTAGAP